MRSRAPSEPWLASNLFVMLPIGVDALEVERTTEVCIMGEGVSHVLLRDGLLRDCILVVAHQEHASQVTDQVPFGVRVITE